MGNPVHDPLVMGSHQQAGALCCGCFKQEVDGAGGVRIIQCAGWLIGHKQIRRADQRAANRGALQLSLAQFAQRRIGAMADAQTIKQRIDLFRYRTASGKLLRQVKVAAHRQR